MEGNSDPSLQRATPLTLQRANFWMRAFCASTTYR